MDRNYPGPCSSCCTPPPCPSPSLSIVSRSASKSKNGSCAFFNSADGNYYLTSTFTASGSGSSPDMGDCSGYYDASYSYTEITTCDLSTGLSSCTASGSANFVQTIPFTRPICGGFLCDDVLTDTVTRVSCGNWLGTHTTQTPTSTDCVTTSFAIDDISPLLRLIQTSTSSTTYTSIYSDALLISTTVAALPSWGEIPPCGSGSGSTELSSAELSGITYSIMQSKYQFCFPVPVSGCYKITWNSVFTPDGGGTPTTTPMSFIWDGTPPPDYNPDDTTTWPVSDIYEQDQPDSNGVVTIANIVASCKCL